MEIQFISHVLASRNRESRYPEDRDSLCGMDSWSFCAIVETHVETQYYRKKSGFHWEIFGFARSVSDARVLSISENSRSEVIQFIVVYKWQHVILEMYQILNSSLKTLFLLGCSLVSPDSFLRADFRHWPFSSDPYFIFQCKIRIDYKDLSLGRNWRNWPSFQLIYWWALRKRQIRSESFRISPPFVLSLCLLCRY
jgi:hypothetical protein